MGWRELAEVKVGDKLTYNPGYQKPYEFRTVARVMKNGIVDSKGDRWTIGGDKWGSARESWSRESCRPFRQQDEETNKELAREAKEKAARDKMHDIIDREWRKMDLKKVHRILAILHEKEST